MGQFDVVFEEAFEEVAQAVEQHPLGTGGLELNLVAQHRRELQWIQLAEVGPGRFVASGLARRCLALAWPRGSIGAKLVVAQIVIGHDVALEHCAADAI